MIGCHGRIYAWYLGKWVFVKFGLIWSTGTFPITGVLLLSMQIDKASSNQVKGLDEAIPSPPPFLYLPLNYYLKCLMICLEEERGYKSFYMHQNGPHVNHLSFADDTIFFCNESKETLEMCLRTLRIYENTSGQLINKNKICFLVANNAKQSFIAKIKLITCMNHQEFPIKYLRWPLISGKKKTIHFNELVKNIINRIKGWHNIFFRLGEELFSSRMYS